MGQKYKTIKWGLPDRPADMFDYIAFYFFTAVFLGLALLFIILMVSEISKATCMTGL